MCSKFLAIVLMFVMCVGVIDAFSYDRFYGFVDAPQQTWDFLRLRSAPQRRIFEDTSDGRVPSKERRAPLEGFEDMSGFLRQIDGIQKPRFGRK